jgi:hypothetical protein
VIASSLGGDTSQQVDTSAPVPPRAMRLLSSRTSVYWVTSAIPATRIPPQVVCSRADREHTHELLQTLLQGVSLLPFTHPRPVCQQLFSNHSHVHSILSFYSYYNTTSSPCFSKRSPSILHSRLPSVALVLSSSCSSNSPSSSRWRLKSSPTHQSHYWRD